MRTPRFLLLLAVALAALFPLLVPGPADAHHDHIEGLWSLVDEILDACPTGNTVRTVIDLKMFVHDGSMIETPGLPVSGRRPSSGAFPGWVPGAMSADGTTPLPSDSFATTEATIPLPGLRPRRWRSSSATTRRR